MQKSRISQLVFEPYIFAPDPAMQGIIYLLLENFYIYFRPAKFERELLKLPDGGTIGLDWDGGIPNAEQAPTQPYLIICPGLGGDSQNLYSMALLWKARAAGYKVVTVLFRGADNIPITSPKLGYGGNWKDVQVAIEYVHRRYIIDPKTQKPRTRLYAYGVSLGALILGLYLGRVGEEAKNFLDGALLYSTPWCTRYSNPYFKASYYGLYNKILGIGLGNKI